jgi:hypothetical protein
MAPPVSQEITVLLRKVRACSFVEDSSLLVLEGNASKLTIVNGIKEDGVGDISNVCSSFMAHQNALDAKHLHNSTNRCILKQLKARNLRAWAA